MNPIEILPDPRGIKDIAIIEGRLPDRVQWRDILDRGLWVNVLAMPDDAPSLAPLVPWADSIRFLMINSYSCSDLRELDRFGSLEWLGIGGRVTAAPAAFQSATLVDYTGPYEGFEMLVTSPHLRRLKLLLGPRTKPGGLSRSVRDLELATATNVSELGSLELPDLERLTIHGARNLSLSGLSGSDVRSLHLESCRRIVDADALASLPSLESCWIENCPDISPIEALLSLSAKVRVVGRNPFDAEFRARAGGNWTFPPLPR